MRLGGIPPGQKWGGDDFGEMINLTESMINRILNERKPLYISASNEEFKIEC